MCDDLLERMDGSPGTPHGCSETVPEAAPPRNTRDLLEMCNDLLAEMAPPPSLEPLVKTLGSADLPQTPLPVRVKAWPAILGVLLLPLLVFGWWHPPGGSSVALPPLPAPFPLPHLVAMEGIPTGNPGGFFPGHPGSRLHPSAHERVAEALLVQASMLQRQGDFRRAEELLNRACLTIPGHPRYERARVHNRLQLQERSEMTAILALTSGGEFDQAWDRFREISGHNPRFFLAEGERFVTALEKSGRVASAVCILRTVTRMRPKDVPARNRLLRMIRFFQGPLESDDHV